MSSRLEIVYGGKGRPNRGREDVPREDTPEQLPQESDEEIISRILSGEREWFRHLLTRHKNQVFSSIMRIVGSRELAEELTQETFLRAYTGLHTFRSQARFSTWLAQIAINATSTYFSSKVYRERRRSVVFQPEVHATSSQSAERELLLQRRFAQFSAALESLPPRLREVLLLCGVEGYPYEEVAVLLGIPVGTVRSRLNTARHRMRELVSEEERKQ